MAKKEVGEGILISGFILALLSVGIVPLFIIFVFLGPSVFGILLGICGLIFGIVQQKKSKTKLGKATIILSIIGIIIGIVSLLFLLFYLMPYLQQAGSFPLA